MEPVTMIIIFLAVVVLTLLAISLFGGALLGRYSTLRPVMSVGIMDYSPLEHGLDPKPVYMKYSPKYGLYGEALKEPLENNKIRVVLKSGWFGWVHHSVVWESKNLELPKDRKRGWGTYKAELLSDGLQGRLESQAFEMQKLKQRNNELARQLLVFQSNVQEVIDERNEKFIKDVQKLAPAMAPKKSTR